MNCLKNRILRIALPSIVSNITVPLLGLVDTAIVGHLGAAVYLAAIAVGGMTFNMVYWLFSFLRMGTGGLTAQAYGAGNEREVFHTLFRSLLVSAAFASGLICLQWAILWGTFCLVSVSGAVECLARSYIQILVWGAPAVLGVYSFSGWFLGMQNARFPMWVSISQNIVNILVSLFLVLGMHLGVSGVAVGTLVAQYAGLLMAAWLWWRHYGSRAKVHDLSGTLSRNAFARFFRVNRDIFLRTLCLVCVSTWFTVAGTSMGDVTLAANALLMQFFVVFSYVMDGFAYAGEALGGRYVGARCLRAFLALRRRLFFWGAGLAMAFTLVYLGLGGSILRLLTSEPMVLAVAGSVLPLACLIPLAGFPAFIYDGLFIGATATRQMLQSMVVAAGTFFLLEWLLPHSNACLWTAFLVYLAMRGLVQATLCRHVVRCSFSMSRD